MVGFINFLPLKIGGLIKGRGAYLRGGLNTGFTVPKKYNQYYKNSNTIYIKQGSAFDWKMQISHSARPIRSTT